MAKVAKQAGLESTMGQSPFAIARGQLFERALFRNDAERLREALDRRGALPAGGSSFVDLRMRLHGGPCSTLDDARARTLDLLHELADDSIRPRPAIIASPTLLIPSGVMLPEALLVIDLVTVGYSDSGVELTVGEVKTYPDRGGYTDAGELASARAQAGVYVHALRMVITQVGLGDSIKVRDEGFLVLSRPGSNRPSVRSAEDLKYQAWRALRGFRQLEAAAKALPTTPPPEEPARLAAVLAAPKTYQETCISFCDLAAGCLRAASDSGDPALLGSDVKRLLGRTSLRRAEELLGGTRPRNDAEKELLGRLRAHAPVVV